jgi:hypothetical protein
MDPVLFTWRFADGFVIPIPTLPPVSNETFGLSDTSLVPDVYAMVFEVTLAVRIGLTKKRSASELFSGFPVALITID